MVTHLAMAKTEVAKANALQFVHRNLKAVMDIDLGIIRKHKSKR